MSGSPMPPITESQILTSYLLPPSPLPTILPYSSFLSLVPNTYRNNPDHSAAIRRLYRDLQFQRDITLSQVQENIERECGAHATTLRANLARRIAIEEGEPESKSQRKRRRVEQDIDSEEASSESNDEDSGVKHEEVESSEDEFTDPLRLKVQQAFYNDPSTMHPAADMLALPADMLNEQIKSEGKSKFHTRTSLLDAMENASRSLDSEIADLEGEYESLKDSIMETVGGLSDLRYGKAGKRKNDGIEETGGEYKDILEALAHFRGLMKMNSTTSQ